MKKLGMFGVIVLGLSLLAGSALGASSDSGTLSITANVGNQAKLSISPGSITFADTSPETASIPANQAVSVSSKVRKGTSSAALTCYAPNLSDGGTNSIPITNVTWTTGSSSYQNGTMNTSASPQTLGTFTASGTFDGTVNYLLANSWAYVPATYTTTVTYSLSAP